MTEEDAHCSAMVGCLEMVRNGTTAFCDSGARFAAELNAEVAAEVGLRGMVSEVCWDMPPHEEVSVGDTDACLARIERQLTGPLPVGSGLRQWAGVGLAGIGTCSDALLAGARDLAEQFGAIVDMHQSFGPADTGAYRQHAGGRAAVVHLDELGILGQNLQLVRMCCAELQEVDLLKRSNTNVVHCPAASTRVAMGVTRHGLFPEMVDCGVNVALGSDSGNYSDFFDVGRQAYLAATIHREARGQMPTISAEQALEMATINGAKSIGICGWTGSLEVGKKADIVLHAYGRPA